MTQVTVIHNGYIIEELARATHSRRYQELYTGLVQWHEIPGHDHEDPPLEVALMLRELKDLKLEAFRRAGQRYREALAAYEQRCDWERVMRRNGWPVAPDTAIHYVEGPREPIALDFDYPA